MGMLRPRPVAWLAELVTVLAARHAGRWPMSGPWSAPRSSHCRSNMCSS